MVMTSSCMYTWLFEVVGNVGNLWLRVKSCSGRQAAPAQLRDLKECLPNWRGWWQELFSEEVLDLLAPFELAAPHVGVVCILSL